MRAIRNSDTCAVDITQSSIDRSVRQSIAAVEAIDPKAASTGRADRYRLAAVAAADLVRVFDIGDEYAVQSALKILSGRLLDAGLYSLT